MVNHVGHQLAGLKPASNHQPDRDGGVEVAARDVANGEGHGEHGETECEGDPHEADAEVDRCGAFCGEEFGREHSAAASAQDQPAGAEELGDEFVFHR